MNKKHSWRLVRAYMAARRVQQAEKLRQIDLDIKKAEKMQLDNKKCPGYVIDKALLWVRQ